MRSSFRAWQWLAICVPALVASMAAFQGCGSDNTNTFPNGELDAGVVGNDGAADVPPIELDAGEANEAATDAPLAQLVIAPAQAVVRVEVVDGVVRARPTQTFTVTADGVPVAANWLLDRAELGDVTAQTGVFTPALGIAGEATVLARANGREASAKIKVVLDVAQNGGETKNFGGGGAGGLGGVGGEPLGAAAAAADVIALNAAPVADPSAKKLYPYDKTVFPRGILAPLLQWETTKDVKALRVKLTQSTLTFTGTYTVAGLTGNAQRRVRVDQDLWRKALDSNDGSSFLNIEVALLGTDNVTYGPLKWQLQVAPAPLTGRVYYNSYDSRLTGANNTEVGGVLSIRVSAKDPTAASDPTLAIPARAGKCHVCHTVSADGSTLFVQEGEYTPKRAGDYDRSLSYDLTKINDPARAEKAYTGAADKHKFTWAAPYPDGSFALASSRFTRESRREGPSALVARSDGAVVPSTGLPVDLDATTPAFSPDGRRVVFNFFGGTAPAGVTTGGRSLAIADFSCDQAPGTIACVGAKREFSNVRALYTNAARFPAWPSWLPDNSGAVFHNTLLGGDCPDAPRANPAAPNSNLNCQLSTWYRAESEIWMALDGGAAARLDLLNGIVAGASYLPEGPDHTAGIDTRVNYMPTINPVPSGGYYWVVFTSRRRYGNVLTGHPFNNTALGNIGFGSKQKKLWVAAIDAKTGALDRSHPPFYLPGQEIASGNSRGYWVVDACKPAGNGCETGDECCGGFCRKDANNQLVCRDKPPNSCSAEFEACKSDADCCNPTLACTAGRCTRRTPPDPN